MRQFSELLDEADSAWPMVRTWIRDARNPVEALPARDPDRVDALVAAQVTTHSTMGAIIYETGGLLIDSGWLRILGSGHPRLRRSLPGWNDGRSVRQPGELPSFLLIGDDVLGGFFAINGGGLGLGTRNVCYFAPDRHEWEDLERGYTEFLQWTLVGELDQFYAGFRWPGWADEVRMLDGDTAYSIYPPLWSEGPSIQNRIRRAIPIAELYDMSIGDDA
jgi:uncharacterized protein DUF2625